MLDRLGKARSSSLLNDVVSHAQLAIVLDACGIADLLGLGRTALTQVVTQGSARRNASSILAPRNLDLSDLAKAVSLLRKDVALIADIYALDGPTLRGVCSAPRLQSPRRTASAQGQLKLSQCSFAWERQ